MMRSLLKSLDRWWFGSDAPHAIALFRIVIGSLALLNLLMIGLDFQDWFSEIGFVPSALGYEYLQSHSRFTLLPFGNSTITAIFYVAVILAAVGTVLGYKTRVCAIALAVGYISLHHRNALILHSGDTMLRLCLVYLACSPAGAAYSLDALQRAKKGLEPILSAPVWAQRLVSFQVAVVYFTTVWHKMYGTYWLDGTASYYPTQLHEFDRFWVPQFMDTGPFFVKLTTYGTLLVELALATLVFWKPARKWVVLAGIAMHGYIEYRFNIPLFAFIMMASYICFYSGTEVQAFISKLVRRKELAT